MTKAEILMASAPASPLTVCPPPPSSQLSQVLLSALNQDLVQFTLKAGVQVNVYASRLSPGERAWERDTRVQFG